MSSNPIELAIRELVQGCRRVEEATFDLNRASLELKVAFDCFNRTYASNTSGTLLSSISSLTSLSSTETQGSTVESPYDLEESFSSFSVDDTQDLEENEEEAPLLEEERPHHPSDVPSLDRIRRQLEAFPDNWDKYYLVTVGTQVGHFTTWASTSASVKHVPGGCQVRLQSKGAVLAYWADVYADITPTRSAIHIVGSLPHRRRSPGQVQLNGHSGQGWENPRHQATS
ncbi:hypothetical protein C8J56DRAFT_1054284 [Mycena floridula]|nr:hypothetical protein C8J56DRAFT_1054284 [Mycena floridula]